MNHRYWMYPTALAAAIGFFWILRSAEAPEPSSAMAALHRDISADDTFARGRSPNADAIPTATPVSSPHLSASRTITVPSRFVFAGNTEVPVADSWEELLAGYTEPQQEELAAFAAEVAAAAYSVKSAEQLEWMVMRGFPMPDDILAASALSDEALVEQALAGNPKAATFALLRESVRDQIEGAYRKDIAATLISDVGHVSLRSGSPFHWYVEAELERRSSPGSPDAPYAGLAMAMMSGDSRALAELAGVKVDAASIISRVSFSQFAQEAARYGSPSRAHASEGRRFYIPQAPPVYPRYADEGMPTSPRE